MSQSILLMLGQVMSNIELSSLEVIYLFNNYFLSACYLPGLVLVTRGSMMKKTEEILTLWSWHSSREAGNKQVNK